MYQRIGLWVINRIARSADYVVREDIKYGDHDRQGLDHYTLKASNNPATVLFFYGGNWRSGRKQDYRFVADTLLKLGFNVIIPDYRLYPLVRFPDIRDDAIKALEQADDLVRDSDLYLMGHSAGAQLAALLSLDQNLSLSHGRIKGCIGMSGPYDFYPFTDDDHWDLFSPASCYQESQAVNYVQPEAPPLYLLHGADDARVRRGHSKSLMEKQQAVGGGCQSGSLSRSRTCGPNCSVLPAPSRRCRRGSGCTEFYQQDAGSTCAGNITKSETRGGHPWHLVHPQQMNC